MNDHNLDDLIIDNIDPKNGKTKSLLTIIALAIVVLIVAIILTRIVLQEPTKPLVLDDMETEMISPELQLQKDEKKKEQSLALEKEKAKHTSNTTQIEAPAVNTQSSESLKDESLKKETIAEVTQKVTQSLNEEKPAATPKVEKNAVAAPQAKPAPEVTKKTKAVPNKNAAKSKPSQTEPAEKKAGKKNVQPSKQSIAKHGYYIQVGSYAQSPSKNYLRIIKNSGFDYILAKASSGGTKKLLIGPYTTRKEADTALVRVRDRINKSAFVVKK